MHSCPCCTGTGMNAASLARRGRGAAATAGARSATARWLGSSAASSSSAAAASDFIVVARAAAASPSAAPPPLLLLPFDPLRLNGRSPRSLRRVAAAAAAGDSPSSSEPPSTAAAAVPRQFSSLDSEYWETEDQPESSGGSGGGGGGSGEFSSFAAAAAAAAAATSTSPSASAPASAPSAPASSAPLPASSGTSTSPSDNYCIIESRESVKDFAALELGAITEAIRARRNRIYFLMEEVRRLRIQERLKSGGFTPPGVAAAASSGTEAGMSGAASPAVAGGTNASDELANEQFPSAIPFFPAVTGLTVKAYGQIYAALVAAIILFGGLAAPVLEVKLGLGGASYAEIIQAARLPPQLAAVDPIVASFCGGAVGVLTTLLIVEENNAALVASNRCVYCGGTGYVACGACAGAGVLPEEALEPAMAGSSSSSSSSAAAGSSSPSISSSSSGGGLFFSNSPLFSSSSPTCAACSGTGKVACIGCLCTGKKVARETDQRLDPFS